MNAVLNAFSFAHEPHMTVNTFDMSLGATDMKASSTESTQSMFGLTPKAALQYQHKKMTANDVSFFFTCLLRLFETEVDWLILKMWDDYNQEG
jgi:hypothetical protein